MFCRTPNELPPAAVAATPLTEWGWVRLPFRGSWLRSRLRGFVAWNKPTTAHGAALEFFEFDRRQSATSWQTDKPFRLVALRSKS